MTRTLFRIVCILMGVGNVLVADDDPAPSSRKRDAVAEFLSARLQTAPLESLGGPLEDVEFRAMPLHRFFNPVSGADGGVFVWLREGVPQVLCKAHVNDRKNAYVNTVVSVGEERLTLKLPGDKVWTPQSPASVSIAVGDAGEVPDNPAVRLSKMKRIAQSVRFEVSWHNDRNAPPQKYVLEWQPRPLLRYSSPKRGIVDGAVFMSCQGTNPEGVAIVEVVEGSEGRTWRAAIAPLTTQGLTVSQGDAIVLERQSSYVVPVRPTDGTYSVVTPYPAELRIAQGSPEGR